MYNLFSRLCSFRAGWLFVVTETETETEARTEIHKPTNGIMAKYKRRLKSEETTTANWFKFKSVGRKRVTNDLLKMVARNSGNN